MTFDLVAERWIPVLYTDGRDADVSLETMFVDAPQIRELAIAFPLEHVAMLRLLAAVLQAGLEEPTSRRAKMAWLADHTGCAARIVAYLDAHREAFDLFDPVRPFMQGTTEDVGLVPNSALRADWSSGNNVTLFDHHVDAHPEPLTPARAARALITTLLFQPGGGVSKPFNRTDSPGTKQLHVLPHAGDLWTTLILTAPSSPSDASRPAWERTDERVPDKAGTRADGWLDRATWRSRAITLVRDEDGLVRACRLHQHLKLDDEADFDPYASVRRVNGKEPTVMRASPTRVLWRDAEALLRGLEDEAQPHGVLQEAVDICDALGLPMPAMRVVGQVVNQAKVGDVRDGRLPVSAELLNDPDRLALLGVLIDRADGGCAALRKAVHAYGEHLKLSDPWALAKPWEVDYWARLASGAYELIAAIATDERPSLEGAAALGWLREVGRAARGVFDGFTTQAGLRPAQLQAQAVARRVLLAGLASIIPAKETVS